MGGVFINYRGGDSGSDTTAALIDRELTARFGSDQVFLDARSIPAGTDFVEELLGRLRACGVLLVVIGSRWLTLTDAAGQRRIDDPADWVRREIAEALAHGLRVIPVVLDDARLPAEADLPADIAGLSRRQYVPLRARYAAVDLAFLVDRIIESDPTLAKLAIRRPGQVSRELGDVFMPAGVPTLTFVESDDFVEFRLALRQPGLGIVLEGPSGIGKTTILRHAVAQDRDRLGPITILSARKSADAAKIRRLPTTGHEGVVAVDDFHRLPAELRDRLADYLKVLADDDEATGKLVVVGIPGTAQSLVTLGSDLATRIQMFQLGRATDSLILQMIEKGEAALNIRFDNRTEICLAATGSLLTAQMLCWRLAIMAGVERTVDTQAAIRTDIRRARAKVTDALRLKYQPMVDEFIVLDASTEPLCIELLLRLAYAPDGILPLQTVREERPDLSPALDRVFIDGMPDGFGPKRARIVEHLFYDPRGQRLIADDPQFMFYLRQLSRDELLAAAGKRLPTPRTQVFVCYSHKDTAWLDQLQAHLSPLERDGVVDVWSDRRIKLGDDWRKEIATALSRARAALLLVSADFLSSDFIRDHELPPLLEAAQNGGCRIIPILVRPSVFEQMPSLARFQHANRGGVTLSEMPGERSERLLADIARSLL